MLWKLLVMANSGSMARKGVAGFVAGLVIVGGAWAGIGLAPVSTDNPTDGLPIAPPEASAAVAELASETEPGAFPDLSQLPALNGGNFYVGAAETSLAPDPSKWQTEGCVKMDQTAIERAVTHLSEIPSDPAPAIPPGWPSSPNCIYMGGYGVPGPARPATGVDPHAGVNVRTIAISNGTETVIWQMLDMVAYFNTYRDDLCSDCGILDIRRTIAERTGGKVKFENVAIGSSHTHGGADGYGVWGGLPDWYREQIRDGVLAGAADALRSMRPATIEIGSVEARPFNNERRDLYHSTADYGAVWLQARELAVPDDKTKKKDPPPAEPPVVATLVNYAAHPVVIGDDNTLLHGDWPATASKALGDDLGGVGLVFEGGLGNVSPSRPAERKVDLTGDGAYDDYDKVIEMGEDFAAFMGKDIDRGGKVLDANAIKGAGVDVEHPVTNWAETGLGIANLLDREFMPDTDGGTPPTGGQWGKGGAAPEKMCSSASATGIRTQVSGFRVGDLTVVTGPGELFSNITEVVKSKARRGALDGGQTMVFAQTQDSLGYIIQSFEVDPLGGLPSYAPKQPGVPVGQTHGEYEETFMADKCLGDHVLQAQLDVLGRLN